MTLHAGEFPNSKVSGRMLLCPADLLILPHPDGGLFGEVERRITSLLSTSSSSSSSANLLKEFNCWMKSYLELGSPKVFQRTEEEWMELHKRFFDFWQLAYFSSASTSSSSTSETNLLNFFERLKVKKKKKYTSLPPSGGFVVPALYYSMGKEHEYRSSIKKALETVEEKPGGRKVFLVHGVKDLQSSNVAKGYASLFDPDFQDEGKGMGTGTRHEVHVEGKKEKKGRKSQFEVQLRFFQNSSHFPFFEEPENFQQLLSEFLSE